MQFNNLFKYLLYYIILMRTLTITTLFAHYWGSIVGTYFLSK